MKPPTSKFAKVVVKKSDYSEGQNRVGLERSIAEWNVNTGRVLDKNI